MFIGDGKTTHKKDDLTKIIFNKGVVLAWDFTEMRKVKRKVAPSKRIEIIAHKTWQVVKFQVPKTLNFNVIYSLQKKVTIKVIKSFHFAYQNVYYLFKKSIKKYWLVNVAFELNRITIQNTNLSPSEDEFSKEFDCFTIFYLIDFLLTYYKVKRAEAS